ncbi:MAG: hypothetical protein QNJ33_11955 [Crocosphaera sp.]|nr:hypothetical protein [Crocosphaera sp.]
MSDEDLKQLTKLIQSNAKAIEALTATIAADKAERKKAYQQWERDRNQLYQYMSRIAAAQSNFYEVQSDYYNQLATLSEKQTTFEQRQISLQEKQTILEERYIELQEKISEQQEQMKLQHSEIIEILNYLKNR